MGHSLSKSRPGVKALATLAALLASVAQAPGAHGKPNRGDPTREDRARFSHAPSGMYFPEQAASCVRDKLRRYDAAGRNVSVTYDCSFADAPLAVTLYVYPAPAGKPAESVQTLLRREMQAIAEEIARAWDGVTVKARGESVTKQAGRTERGALVIFRLRPKDAADAPWLLSETHLFVHGPWFLKYRYTYPEHLEAIARERLKAFMAAVAWPRL